MAQATTYNVSGDREDLLNFLTILEPEDTPKVSSFPKTPRPNNVFQEWQVDDLAPVDFSGVIEGRDVQAFNNEAADRSRIGSRIQRFRRPWAVSEEQEASDPAGVASEVANSKTKAMREVKRSIEACIGSDNDLQQGSGTLPSKTRALGNWISSSGPSDVPAIFRTPAASIDSTATASLTESNFNDVFQSIFQRVGGARSYTLFAGPSLKRAISNFQRATGSAGTTKTYQVTQDATEHQIDLNVSFYEGDFHTVTIIPDLFNGLLDGAAVTSTTNQQKARGYVINRELVGIGSMIPMYSRELEDQGGGPRGFVSTTLVLVVKNPAGLGKFAASS
jgi:hypothetical protein